MSALIGDESRGIVNELKLLPDRGSDLRTQEGLEAYLKTCFEFSTRLSSDETEQVLTWGMENHPEKAAKLNLLKPIVEGINPWVPISTYRLFIDVNEQREKNIEKIADIIKKVNHELGKNLPGNGPQESDVELVPEQVSPKSKAIDLYQDLTKMGYKFNPILKSFFKNKTENDYGIEHWLLLVENLEQILLEQLIPHTFGDLVTRLETWADITKISADSLQYQSNQQFEAPEFAKVTIISAMIEKNIGELESWFNKSSRLELVRNDIDSEVNKACEKISGIADHGKYPSPAEIKIFAHILLLHRFTCEFDIKFANVLKVLQNCQEAGPIPRHIIQLLNVIQWSRDALPTSAGNLFELYSSLIMTIRKADGIWGDLIDESHEISISWDTEGANQDYA